MQASLARARAPEQALPRPLLDPRGAGVILGTQPALPVAPIAPSASALFGPRGACLAAPQGPLFVCDTGHHRVLVWNELPGTDDAPADLVIGQPDFATEGRHGLNVPSGIATAQGVLAVADAWNHRVLLWRRLPQASNQPPDVVLGEGRLNWPYGVALHDGRLYVADTGNRRVLVWHRVPTANEQAPDLVFEQGMRWPHGLLVAGDRLFVADAGTNRIHRWKRLAPIAPVGEDLSMPYGVALLGERLVIADTANSRLLGLPLEGGPAQWLAGQVSFADKGDNRWSFAARDSLCWPYGIAACGSTLVIADSGNNRVLLWAAA